MPCVPPACLPAASFTLPRDSHTTAYMWRSTVHRLLGRDDLELRRDLAAAHHLSHAYRFDDLIWNHISARVPGHATKYMVTSGTEHFDEVTASSLVLSTSANANATTDTIHGAIYAARPDVMAIVHHHSTAVVAVSALPEGFKCLSQESTAFHGNIAYHDYQGVSDSSGEGARIVEALGTKCHTLIMRNHGACTTGASVAEAWVRYYYLDLCCRQQLAVAHVPRLIELPKAVLEHSAAQFAPGTMYQHGNMEWTALRRHAARLQARARCERLLAWWVGLVCWILGED